MFVTILLPLKVGFFEKQYLFTTIYRVFHRNFFLFEVDFKKSGIWYLQKNNVFAKFWMLTFSTNQKKSAKLGKNDLFEFLKKKSQILHLYFWQRQQPPPVITATTPINLMFDKEVFAAFWNLFWFLGSDCCSWKRWPLLMIEVFATILVVIAVILVMVAVILVVVASIGVVIAVFA